MVSSTDFVRASERPTAIATLNREPHLTPSCGGLTPTAERTVGPAGIIVGELDSQTRNLRTKSANKGDPFDDAAHSTCRFGRLRAPGGLSGLRRF